MLRLMFTCVAVMWSAAVVLPAQTARSSAPPDKPARTVQRRAAKPAPKVQQPPPQPTAIAPMTPEQLPAAAPRVSYQNGVLTVESDNSTLGAILQAIRRQTGAQIDLPPTGSGQRVAAHLSGSPRQVISSLLDGSELGYAIIGAPDNPERVQQVILMVQSRNAGQPAAFGGGAPPPQAPPPTADAMDTAPVEEGPTPEQMNERYPVDRQGQPGQLPEQPGQPSPNGGGEQVPMPERPPQMPPQPSEQNPPQAQSGQPQAKTPEQLLQELQRMRNGRSQ